MAADKAEPEAAPQPLPLPKPNPIYSSLCPSDLGLKAGYWDGDEQHPVVFRDIVGWIVVANAADVNVVPFQPVVLNDLGAPLFAVNVPGHIGVFAKTTAPEEARQKYELWKPKTGERGAAGGQSGPLN